MSGLLNAPRELSIEDQISLLKGAMFEVCQIRFNMLFNDETGVWECGALTYCMDDAARGELRGRQCHSCVRNTEDRWSSQMELQNLHPPPITGVRQGIMGFG